MKRILPILVLPLLLGGCLQTLGIIGGTLGASGLNSIADTAKETFNTDINRQIAANAKQDDRVAIGSAKCLERADKSTKTVDDYIEAFDKCLATAAKYQPTFIAEQLIGRIRDKKAEREAAEPQSD